MKRSLFYLGIVIVIAFLAWFIERPDLSSVSDVNDELILPDFNADQVTRIEIEQLVSGVQLERREGIWHVAPFVTKLGRELAEKEKREIKDVEWFVADEARIHHALGVFGDLSRGLVVSSNPENQNLYNVGVAGLTIRLFGPEGKRLIALIIGKNGPDLVTQYVRRDGENDVLLVDRTLTGIFSIAAEDWKLKESPKADESKEDESQGEQGGG